MGKKGPLELGDMEIFSEVLEDLAERGEEVKYTFHSCDPKEVQEAFGHSAEFSTAWAASIAAIDQAFTDGFVFGEEQRTRLYAYLYEFLGPVYEKAEVHQLEENIQRLVDREPEAGKDPKLREQADFFTTLIAHHFPTADHRVEVRPLEPEEQREDPLARNMVTVEFTGPTGSRETIITASRDLMRDDDPGMERIATYLYARFECQREMEEEEERER